MKFRSQVVAVLCFAALALTACSKKLEGTYKDDLGLQKYEFKSDGNVYVSTMGITKESKYTVEDKKVKIKNGDDVTIYDLQDDGTIKGPLGMLLKPQPEK